MDLSTERKQDPRSKATRRIGIKGKGDPTSGKVPFEKTLQKDYH
jgi:hypothetical protein